MIKKRWQWLILSLVSVCSLLLLFFALTVKSKANLEDRINNQVELFREEIVKAIVSEDTYTLRRYSESFRGIKDDSVRFMFQSDLVKVHTATAQSCGFHIEIPVKHMGIFLGEFLICRSWAGTLISTSSDPWFLSMSFVLIGVIIFSTIVPLSIYRRTTRKILSSIEDGTDKASVSEHGLDEVQIKILGFIREHVKSKIELERQHLILENNKNIVTFASQISHDIRSPLSALNMILGQLTSMPEDRRIIVRNAVQRINDIANTMLDRAKPTHEQQSNASNPDSTVNNNNAIIKTTTEFLPALVDILVSEKRVQYREYGDIEIEADLKDSFGTFAQINSIELKRVISNLVNNSVEAFSECKGRVTVGVRKVQTESGQKAEVFVKDNGKGIPKHILDKLGLMGVSEGKNGTQSGSGLGIFHAKSTAESFGGNIKIESAQGNGTEIKIILPLADAPKWFTKTIDLSNKKYLVSLDDDISIHQIWAGRLQSLNVGQLEHVKFQSGDAFEKYVNANINKLRETIFLIDYELLNQPKTGLDIIEELGLEKYSILITSRYEEPEIQQRALRLKLSLLPKSLSGFVPIAWNRVEKYDWVLLDDDELVHTTWKFAAQNRNKSFIGFYNHLNFLENANQIHQESDIFVDSNLGNGIKGEEIAKTISDLGFKNIFLCTGYHTSQFEPMPWIKGVVGKEPQN